MYNIKQLEVVKLNFSFGDSIKIYAYKHDESLHRTWRGVNVVLYNDEMIVVANTHAKVIESSGRNWFTQEPSIAFFYFKYFYNVIAMLKKDGIYFYCNLSSPAVADSEGIKYVDYDLDVRVTPSFTYKVLDKKEYLENSLKYGYSDDLKEVIEKTLKYLLVKIKDKKHPFNHDYVLELFNKFKDFINKS